MKNCAVLVHLKAVSSTGQVTFQQIDDYIGISLNPYKELGVFAYQSPSKESAPVWGKENTKDFISVLATVSTRPLLSCKELTGGLSNINIDLTRPLDAQYSPAIKEAIQLLCGVLTIRSGFYYCSNKTCLLGQDDFQQIMNATDEYVLVFIDLYC